jgi:protein-L-isoaspartate(D-aspartate) O-methyltransferase
VLRTRPDGYVPTPSADPVYLYVNQVVGLLAERNLNNGEPSLHAMMIASAAPKEGEHAVHIGIGGGYYTAILAELVGETGRVTAIELDAGLAEPQQTYRNCEMCAFFMGTVRSSRSTLRT